MTTYIVALISRSFVRTSIRSKEDALVQAENCCHLLGSELYPRSHSYLLRSRALAWYRKLLLQGEIHSQYEPELMRSCVFGCEAVEDWIRCCLGKYVGACEAAKGHQDEARRWFAAAINAIADADSSQIKGLIRVTACAEAWRSLQDEEARQRGLDILDKLPLPLWTSAEKFRRYLNREQDEFPGRSYWY